MGTGWRPGGCLCPCSPALSLPAVFTFKEAKCGAEAREPTAHLRHCPCSMHTTVPCPFSQKTFCGPGFQTPTRKVFRAQQSALWHSGGPLYLPVSLGH